MSEFKVYIAEKPSVGKALAESLSKRSRSTGKSRSSIEGPDWAVCWLSGHVFEQAQPDYYIPKLFPGTQKTAQGKYPWSFDTLPIIPGQDQWSINPVASKHEMISTVRDLVKKATVVVNAGDIDREGQLLVDEVLDEIKCRKPVMRILPTAIDEKSIEKALANERDNREFSGMRDAALARGRSDWLVGMNFSRGVTLRARECGGNGLVSIGRVQTPILGLIVRRELEIQGFKPIDYFAMTADIAVKAGSFKAKWKPRANAPGVDEEGRLVDPAVAQQLQFEVNGKTGVIADYRDEKKTQPAPLPFSIQDIQKVASRKFGMPLERTLATVQSLYETHKAVSYPRSDCSFLPSSQHQDAPDILAAVQRNFAGTDIPAVSSVMNAKQKSRAFDDKRVTAHHAIVPTSKSINLSSLSADEKLIYEEIARRYLAQFMPIHTYRSVSVRAEIAGQDFVATGRTTIDPGWKSLYMRSRAPGAAAESDDGQPDDESVNLPVIVKGEPAKCNGLDKEAKKATPPARFNDASLLDAMVNIHKFCTSPNVKAHFEQMLAKNKGGAEDEAQGCGIGTPATRHTFVPKLIDVELVQAIAGGKKTKQKSYAPTEAGMALVQALPRVLTVPDMSAVWDMAFSKIESKEVTLAEFMTSQERQITNTLTNIRKLEIKLPEGAKAAEKKVSNGRKVAHVSAADSGVACEKCGSGQMRKRTGAKGEFHGCSNYPACKHTLAA
ncbi:MAG: DNA topoisomerase [Lysobacter sp.]